MNVPINTFPKSHFPPLGNFLSVEPPSLTVCSITFSSSPSVLLPFITQFHNPSLLPTTHHQFWLIHGSHSPPPACPGDHLERAQRSIGGLTYWTAKGHNVSRGVGQTWKLLQIQCRFVLFAICSVWTYITNRVKAGKVYHQLSGQGIW